MFSPLKDLPAGPEKKLQDHWSTAFYEHVFKQIDEAKFAALYDDGYSRPNKPVNELVSLEIIKHLRGLSDKELEYAYIFDPLVRNALGKETLGDNICLKTFTNFRRRLLEFEEETGRNLLEKVFEEHRDYFFEEFDVDGSTQRMDSTFIEANIRQLSRINLIAKVVHTFLNDLPAEQRQELPVALIDFADRDNLHLSYQLTQDEVEEELKTLLEHAVLLVDRFENVEPYTDYESFVHVQRVLDEQCVRIPALEEDDGPIEDNTDDDDDDGSGWEPLHSSTRRETSSDDAVPVPEDSVDSAENEDGHSGDEGHSQEGVALKDAEDVGSDSLQNPHDDEATYREKNGESHHGYKANWTETCGEDDSLRVITHVDVETNNTEDTELLERSVEELAIETGLSDLLSDAGYSGEAVEAECTDAGVTQHFSAIKGRQVADEGVSVADATFDDHELVACPQGHRPYDQEYTPENDRYWGRMDTDVCATCPQREECFVEEKQEFYSYGFYGRTLEVARHRAKLTDPEMEEILNLRAGAESMINEVSQGSRNRTRFTGKIKVKNASIATAMGRNLKRASEFLESGSKAGQSAG